MYLECIKAFQIDCYNLIAENQELKKYVKGVHYTTQINAEMPMILINFLTAKNLTEFNFINYELNFDIGILIGSYTIGYDMELGEKVISILRQENYKFNLYKIVSLRLDTISWIAVNATLNRRLNLNYRAIIQQVY